ncbi:MAG: hypothetical protein ACM3NR_04585 [Methanosarcina sp.]
MDTNSTPFVSFSDINVDETDLYEDAWGYNSQFIDVIELLGQINVVPGDRLTKDLIEMIRRQN